VDFCQLEGCRNGVIARILVPLLVAGTVLVVGNYQAKVAERGEYSLPCADYDPGLAAFHFLPLLEILIFGDIAAEYRHIVSSESVDIASCGVPDVEIFRKHEESLAFGALLLHYVRVEFVSLRFKAVDKENPVFTSDFFQHFFPQLSVWLFA
jgi:hypothetical protein